MKYQNELYIWLVNISAIGITFSNVEQFLKIISLLAAIGYTVWRWQKDYFESNKKKKK